MKTLLLTFIWVILTTVAKAQELPAAQLTNLVSSSLSKAENFLSNNGYAMVLSEMANDSNYKTYEFRAGKNKRQATDSFVRSVVIARSKDAFDVTYHTSSPSEYQRVISALKNRGLRCDYEKDQNLQSPVYVYQNLDETAEYSTTTTNGHTCHCIKMHRQAMPTSDELSTADDLLKFTSHEYLVQYFGSKNVRKDLFYFAQNDVVNCSVLFMNTARQVIFVWKDPLNRRQISNLIFGGNNKLKSQQEANVSPVQNQWRLKSGLRPGMQLMELRKLNEKEILFCGGNAPNPGLVLPESSGGIDFSNADVVLECVNCGDEKFMTAARLNSDAELRGGRILFVISVVLYPPRL